MPSQSSGGIAVFGTGELTQGATVRDPVYGALPPCPTLPCPQRTLFQALFMLFPTPTGGLYVRNEVFRTGPGSAALNNAAGGDIAQSFVKSYYDTFDADRRALAAIYVRGFASCIFSIRSTDVVPNATFAQRESSMLLFEGASAVGVAPILAKLAVSASIGVRSWRFLRNALLFPPRPSRPRSTKSKLWTPSPSRKTSSTSWSPGRFW